MKKKNFICRLLFAVITFGIAIVGTQTQVYRLAKQNEYEKMKITDEKFRSEFFSEEQNEYIQLYSLECKTILKNVEKDVSYYPVAESSVDKSLFTSFSNSWMEERTYGGKRGHEGVDIMASKDIRGVFPVVSMTDGIVTNKGWIEKGGYRIGITSDSGIYYYYAHLDSFANITEGQRIKAGELLGFMGDSGYGPEGTTGRFPVHLHVGIYVYKDGHEISLNPYYVLCSKEKRITFS